MVCMNLNHDIPCLFQRLALNDCDAVAGVCLRRSREVCLSRSPVSLSLSFRAGRSRPLPRHSGVDDTLGVLAGRRHPGLHAHTYGRQEWKKGIFRSCCQSERGRQWKRPRLKLHVAVCQCETQWRAFQSWSVSVHDHSKSFPFAPSHCIAHGEKLESEECVNLRSGPEIVSFCQAFV